MKTILLDTSVIISLYANDSNRAEAEKILKQIERNNLRIIIPNLVIGEVVGVLTKNSLSKDEIEAILRNLLSMYIKVQDFNPREWLDEIYEVAKLVNLKSMDLLILTTCKVFKPHLFASLDKRLSKAYTIISNHLV